MHEIHNYISKQGCRNQIRDVFISDNECMGLDNKVGNPGLYRGLRA